MAVACEMYLCSVQTKWHRRGSRNWGDPAAKKGTTVAMKRNWQKRSTTIPPATFVRQAIQNRNMKFAGLRPPVKSQVVSGCKEITQQMPPYILSRRGGSQQGLLRETATLRLPRSLPPIAMACPKLESMHKAWARLDQ